MEARLKPVLEEISKGSQALASNLHRCITKFISSDRYLRAFRGETISSKESELSGDEFMIFREYVRLLRSCTIMCGKDTSSNFKNIFLEVFSGQRLELARKLAGE